MVSRAPKHGNRFSKATLSRSADHLSEFRAASFNVEILSPRLAEVIETLTRRKIDLCCIQEHRFAGGLDKEQVREYKGKNSLMKFFWCGKEEGGQGGVGIMLAEKWCDKVITVERLSDRIILLKLIIGKQIFTFISLYAPQSGLPQAAKDHFYDQLRSVVMSVPSSEVLFCLGDWNGHVGASANGYEDVHGSHGFGTRNSEGVSILEFAMANDLLVGNTWFIKRDSHLISYYSGPHRTQVDYALYRRNFRKSVTNVKVIPGEECATKHQLLVCDLTIHIPHPKKRKFTPRLKSWKLRDPAVASKFHDVFRAKVLEAQTCKEGPPVEN